MGRRDRNRRPARRRPAIEPRERILVLCEGKNTEPQYIDGFRRWCRNPLVEVEIARDVHGVPLTLVQKAKQQWQAARAQAKRERDDFLTTIVSGASSTSTNTRTSPRPSTWLERTESSSPSRIPASSSGWFFTIEKIPGYSTVTRYAR
jgi:hypothetical protein